MNTHFFHLLAISTLFFTTIADCHTAAHKQAATSEQPEVSAQDIAIALVKNALEMQMYRLMLDEIVERISSLKQEARVHPGNTDVKKTIGALENVMKELQAFLDQNNSSTTQHPQARPPSPQRLALELLMTLQLVEELKIKAQALNRNKTTDPQAAEEMDILKEVIHLFELDIQEKRGILAHITQELVI